MDVAADLLFPGAEVEVEVEVVLPLVSPLVTELLLFGWLLESSEPKMPA